MHEPMIRGHVIHHTARFFRLECDPAIALRIDASLPLEQREAMNDLSDPEWYPRRYETALLNGVSRAFEDEETARAQLIRCGTSLAIGHNEFMKLLVRVLTPELFVRKLERFWARDHRDAAGYVVENCDLERHSASLRLRGVAGYTHCGLIWLGWMRGILNEISPGGFSVEQHGWSWAHPDPDEIVYEVKWS
jgi:hypothetical protein